MNYERQKRLVEKLLERSRSGNLPWQEGVTSGTFQVSFPNTSVQISFVNRYSDVSFVISVLDESGRITDNFDDDDLQNDNPHLSGSWKTVMQELYALARRRALRSDEIIDSILSEIN